MQNSTWRIGGIGAISVISGISVIGAIGVIKKGLPFWGQSLMIIEIFRCLRYFEATAVRAYAAYSTYVSKARARWMPKYPSREISYANSLSLSRSAFSATIRWSMQS